MKPNNIHSNDNADTVDARRCVDMLLTHYDVLNRLMISIEQAPDQMDLRNQLYEAKMTINTLKMLIEITKDHQKKMIKASRKQVS